MRFKLLPVVGIALLFPFFLSAASGLAQGGIGIYPALIEWKDVVRGSEYIADVGILNGQDYDLPLAVTPEGEVEGWISVSLLSERTTKLEQFVVPPHGETRLVLRLLVPQDAPNGLHRGTVYFTSRGATQNPSAGSPSTSQTSVNLGVGTDLRVSVSGNQRLLGTVSDVYVTDTEVNYPLRFSTTFHNTGNVLARPQIDLTVKNASAAPIGEAQYADWAFTPGENRTVTADWDTTGKDAGEYIAAVKVSLGGQSIWERDLGFQILPRGTLTRLGSLEGLRLADQPRPGTVGKVLGTFFNYGRIDTRAKFIGELYSGSTLVDAVSSEERLVAFGEKADLEMFVRLPDEGEYSIRGKVNYEGKETEVRQLTFNVSSGRRLPGELGIGVAILIMLLAGAFVASRHWRFGPAAQQASAPPGGPQRRSQGRLADPPSSGN